MAETVHRRPPIFLLTPILFLFSFRCANAQSSLSPPVYSGGAGFNLGITLLLLVILIVALFFLGFFTAYLRRCTGNRTVSSNAAVAAAAAAAFATSTRERRLRGLDPSAVESFPAVPFSTVRHLKPGKGAAGSIASSPECAVCLGEFSDEETLRLLPGCRHIFHAHCIDTWLSAHVTCPVCRADLSDPVVIVAGRCLAADLAEEPPDELEIIVEFFEPDPYPVLSTVVEPVPVPAPDPLPGPVLPEEVRKEAEPARLRRAASLVSFQGERSGPWASLIRTLSGHKRNQNQTVLDLGESSCKRILPEKPDLDGSGTGAEPYRGSVSEVGSACSDRERHCAHSLTFTGFVLRGDVASNDWRPEIFHVSTNLQLVSNRH